MVQSSWYRCPPDFTKHGVRKAWDRSDRERPLEGGHLWSHVPIHDQNLRSSSTPTMTTSNLTFLDFLKPRRNEAALRLRNSILALAVLFVITNLSSAFPSILSSLTVVWNAVAPPQTPSKSRTGSGSNINHGAEVGFWWWTISLIGAHPTPR